MTDDVATAQIGGRIPAELDARIERIRATVSLRHGDPEGGPSRSQILRYALEDWVEAQERALRLEVP
jgi:hypothetical protein